MKVTTFHQPQPSPDEKINKDLYITKRGQSIVNAHWHFSGYEIQSTLHIHKFHIEGVICGMEIFFGLYQTCTNDSWSLSPKQCHVTAMGVIVGISSD